MSSAVGAEVQVHLGLYTGTFAMLLKMATIGTWLPMKWTLTCTGMSMIKGKVKATLCLKGGLCYDTHIFLLFSLYLTSCITTAVT